MKESIKNWIGFFRKAHLAEGVVAKVYSFLLKYSPNSYVSREDFIGSVTAKETEVVEIITGLDGSGLVELHFKCPECATELPKSILLSYDTIVNCPTCDAEFSVRSLNCIKILDHAVSQSELNSLLFYEGYDKDANEFINIGSRQGFILYLITDIEGSQKLQKTDIDKYNTYLRFLQKKAWPNSIRVAKKRRLLMFGRGDCIVYAFIDVEDAIDVLIHLRDQIAPLSDLRLSAHLLHLPIEPTDRKYFMLNMEGKWDFNVTTVTDAYRISTIKPSVWGTLEKDRYKIKFAIIGEAYSMLKSHGIKRLTGIEEEIAEAPKHDIPYREKCFAGSL